jgi:hypothetical protein
VKAFPLLEAEQPPMLVDVPKPKAGSGQVANKVGDAEQYHTDLVLMHRKKALHALALGIERIGLVSLRFPLAVALAMIALAIAAGFGVARIKVDDSLSQLFRSDTQEFKQYEEVTRRFPSSEFDVLVVIEGKTLLARESIEKLRDLVTDLQLIDGTRGIISIFSARQPPEDGGIPAAPVPCAAVNFTTHNKPRDDFRHPGHAAGDNGAQLSSILDISMRLSIPAASAVVASAAERRTLERRMASLCALAAHRDVGLE